MSEQLQLRRGNASQVAAFAGASGEVVIDTDNSQVIVNDGSTVGGFRASMARRTAVADANHTAVQTERIVAYTSITAARTVALPAASAFPPGEVLRVVDESGSCSAANTITLAPAGSDTIDGATSSVINIAYGALALVSDGSSKWTVVGQVIAVSSQVLTQGANGSKVTQWTVEQLVSGLSGSNVSASTQIAAGALVESVSMRVTTTITGATSWTLGYSGNASIWGSSLGLSVGTTNIGVALPTPMYSATSIVLTAIGGSFTAGAVRLSAMYRTFTPPTS